VARAASVHRAAPAGILAEQLRPSLCNLLRGGLPRCIGGQLRRASSENSCAPSRATSSGAACLGASAGSSEGHPRRTAAPSRATSSGISGSARVSAT